MRKHRLPKYEHTARKLGVIHCINNLGEGTIIGDEAGAVLATNRLRASRGGLR
jgi:hypothetical protein